MNFIDGEVLYIDKPYRWTSFDVVKRVRGTLLRRMRMKRLKVGHAGTLDPLATGVMAICTGKATKLIDTLQAHTKEYVATIALGATTPSFDLETEIDARYPVEHITRELVESVLSQFKGAIEQVPPAFSACKIAGQRAYHIARKGGDVDIKPLEFSPESIVVRVVCSKGTYIRALARDIGKALGSGGHLTALRRTRVGDINVEDCLPLDKAIEILQVIDIEMPEDDDTQRK